MKVVSIHRFFALALLGLFGALFDRGALADDGGDVYVPPPPPPAEYSNDAPPQPYTPPTYNSAYGQPDGNSVPPDNYNHGND